MDFTKPPYFGSVEVKRFGSALATAKFIAPEIVQTILNEGYDVENEHYEKVGDCNDPIDNLI